MAIDEGVHENDIKDVDDLLGSVGEKGTALADLIVRERNARARA